MRDVTIVVPCFNEALRLRSTVFRAFARAQPQVRFLFVDDGSTDETADVIERLVRRDDEAYTLLALKENQGKGQAVRLGVLEALAQSPRLVGYWDADLATSLDVIPEFISLLEARPELALVMGSRFPGLGHRIERRRVRRYLGRTFAELTALTLGLECYDTQCGAKLFRATADLPALFAEPFLTRWLFDVELLARMRRSRGAHALATSVYEQPLDAWREVQGSKLHMRDFARAVVELARIRFHYR